MYTVIISILSLTSVYIVSSNWTLFKSKKFIFWLLISCAVGWIEFVCFLRYNAWEFAPEHVLGIEILNVTIEDILFCPCFSVIFYWLYFKTKNVYIRVYNPQDKLLFTMVVFLIALFNYDLGSQFSKYMALRASIGFIGLIYCWNYSSFRHSILFLLIVYAIGFGWDLPSVSLGVWVYIEDVTNISKIYDGLYFTILRAKFPVELFGYYFTGGFFSFWTLAFLDKYFSESYNLRLGGRNDGSRNKK